MLSQKNYNADVRLGSKYISELVFTLLRTEGFAGSVFHWQFLITYKIFRNSKVWSILYHGSVGWVKSTECYMFTYTFWAFFIIFHKRFCFFLSFSFLFWWSIKYPQQNINQRETGIDDQRLSLEPYASVSCHVLMF